MDPEYQKDFRTDLKKLYLRHAFECLGLYTYWGKKFSETKKNVDDYEARVGKAEEAFKKLQDITPRTADVRAQMSAAKKDIDTYKGILGDGSKGLVKVYVALERKCQDIQREAIEYLEQAEEMGNLTFKSREEIEAERLKTDGEKTQ